MRKYTKLFISINLFFCLFFIGTKSLLAKETSDKFTKSFIGTYHYVDTSGKYGDFEHFSRLSDGKIAYCIEPGVSLSTEMYQGYYDLGLDGMSNMVLFDSKVMQKISLISYYGWGYQNHNNDEWIVATQALIWNTLGRKYNFTSKNNREDPFKYVIEIPQAIKEKMNEIESLVNNYLIIPNLSSYHVKIPVRSFSTINDYNGVLNNFKVDYCENCNATLNNNELKITPNNNYGGNIRLKKDDQAWDNFYYIYVNSTGQDLIVPGNIDPIYVDLSYSVISGSLTLHNYDFDNKTCKPQTGGELKGSIYKLYKEDGTFVQDLIIDENCNYSVNDLDLGRYYIKQQQPGLNYEEDNEKYYFDLNLDDPNRDIIIYSKIYHGELRIKKLDLDKKTCENIGEATLKGAVYSLFKSDGTFIQNLTIDNNCSAKTEHTLLLGDYYIKEIEAPKGYKIDEKSYTFSITKENADTYAELVLYDEIYKTKLEINKTFLKNANVYPEKDAKFEIYFNGNLIKTITTDKNGKAFIVLPFGKYLVKQISGKKDYLLSDDFTLNVTEDSNEVTYVNLLNKPYTARLKINKVDENNNIIKKSGIKFKIYDIQNNSYVCQTVSYPNVENICEFETNSSGYFITPFKLYPSKYRLEEVDQYMDGYVWNKNTIEFSIGEETNFIYDETLGNILELNFVNKKVKGSINIHKIGESLIIAENKYQYKNINLSNVIFEIIANEDIYENGILIYKNNDIVSRIQTNNEGIATINNLPLGKYKIKEISSSNNNMIDNNLYEVEIKYKDQYTAQIDVDITLNNYLPKGKLSFLKIDKSTNLGLKGVLIGIYNMNDELIFLGYTDKSGHIELNDLFLGKFYLKELKPLDGYKTNDEIYYFEIKENQDIVYMKMENSKIKGVVEIQDRVLNEDDFDIYDETGNLVYEGKTSNGRMLKELEFGSYYAIRKSDPNDKRYFTLNEENPYVLLVFDKKEIILPNTKLNITKDEILIAIITILLSSLLTMRYEKK